MKKIILIILVILFVTSGCDIKNNKQNVIGKVVPHLEKNQDNYIEPQWLQDSLMISSYDLKKFKVEYKQNIIVANAIDFFKGKYVEVGRNVVKVSADAYNWNKIDVGIDCRLNAIAHNDTTLVIVGHDGMIFTTKDLSEWKIQRLDSANVLFNVKWINNKFIAVGSNGAILSSTDGETWSCQSVNAQYDYNDIAWGNDQYIVVGGQVEEMAFEFKKGKPAIQVVLVSKDGINWEKPIVTKDNALSAVKWYNSKFITASGFEMHTKAGNNAQNLFLSQNGLDWSSPDTKAAGFKICSFASSDNLIVGVGDGFIISNDGESWETIEGFEKYKSVVWDGKRFVAINVQGDIISSIDGRKWNYICVGNSIINDINFDGKQYRAVGGYSSEGGAYNGNGTLIASKDGSHWERSILNISSKKSLFEYKSFKNICYNNNNYMLTTGTDIILLSNNGYNWDEISTGNNGITNKIAFGNNKYVAVGREYPILSSSDGKQWMNTGLNIDNELKEHRVKTNDFFYGIEDVIWNGEEFAAASNWTTILISKDGIKWVPHHLEGFSDFIAIAYGNGKYVACSASSFAVSKNGMDWEFDYYSDCKFTNIIWHDNKFIVTGFKKNKTAKQSFIYISEDGKNWTEKNFDYDTYFKKVYWDGEKYIFIGNIMS